MLLLAGTAVGATDGLSPEDEAFLRGISQDYFKITSSIFISFTSQTGVTQGGFVFDGEAGTISKWMYSRCRYDTIFRHQRAVSDRF